MITIKAGNLDVLASGVLVPPKDTPLVFELPEKMIVTVTFQIDSKKLQPRCDVRISDSKTEANFSLVNFYNVGFTQLITPLGSLTNRDLYFLFWSGSLVSGQSTPDRFYYTWYLGPIPAAPVSNGPGPGAPASATPGPTAPAPNETPR